MKTKNKPFIGTWSILEMEAWDQEYVNMEVPGHFTFKKDGIFFHQGDDSTFRARRSCKEKLS